MMVLIADEKRPLTSVAAVRAIDPFVRAGNRICCGFGRMRFRPTTAR